MNNCVNGVNSVFPSIIYILLAILLVVLIILVLRLIKTLGKVDRVVEDVNYKVNKLNGVFEIIDTTTDAFVSFNDRIVNFLTNGIVKIFKKNKKKERKYDE